MAFTFKNSENLPPKTVAPNGDYPFTVIDAESSVIPSGRLSGTTKWTITLQIEGHPEFWLPTDDLIESEKFQWRVDTFLKAANVQVKVDEQIEFNKALAEQNKTRWVNLIGLRGWAQFGTEEYVGKRGPGKKNIVLRYYTDKPKLPRNEELAKKAEEETTPF